MKKWTVGSILILFIFLSVFLSQGQEKSLDPGGFYDSAMELFLKGRYGEAIEGFFKINSILSSE
jgi:TolA-binding protein